MKISRFTIRVYGILVNENNQVLLVHETMPHLSFTKFPGGGMEFGEGTRECLQREFLEETGCEVVVKEHLYTTDFFQPSAFNSGDQLMAIYYRVEPKNQPMLIPEKEVILEINGKTEKLNFYWQSLADFKEEQLTFPIDKIVARKFLISSH